MLKRLKVGLSFYIMVPLNTNRKLEVQLKLIQRFLLLFYKSSVLRSVRRTKKLMTKITVVSSSNWVERIRIY